MAKKVMKKVAKKKKAEKIKKVMHEFEDKKLRSGSKKGPVVKKKDQALAIAYSEADKKNNSKNK